MKYLERNYILIGVFVALACSVANAQTWGCGERDYKCQLDGRMKALAADPKNPENYYDIGIVFQRTKNHAQAVESLSMYVLIPGVKTEYLSNGYNSRGISQRALGKPQLAYDDYTKAIELNPKAVSPYINRGNVSRDLGKTDQAFADYARAIVLDPKAALAYSNRGRIYSDLSEFDEALKDLAKAIELDPTNAEPFYTRAMIYRSTREHAKAIADLDKYIAIDPGNPQYLADGHLNRGINYAMLSKFEAAEKDITKAIEISPKYIDAYRSRALVYRQQKKNALAEADEQKAAELAGLLK